MQSHAKTGDKTGVSRDSVVEIDKLRGLKGTLAGYHWFDYVDLLLNIISTADKPTQTGMTLTISTF